MSSGQVHEKSLERHELTDELFRFFFALERGLFAFDHIINGRLRRLFLLTKEEHHAHADNDNHIDDREDNKERGLSTRPR